jgi:hypothetical protein
MGQAEQNEHEIRLAKLMPFEDRTMLIYDPYMFMWIKFTNKGLKRLCIAANE